MKKQFLKTITIISVIVITAMAQTEIWDGTSDTTWYNNNLDRDTFFISNGKELSALSKLVSGGVTFTDKTINLTDDIDLGDKSWTPIGNDTKQFRGVFDGKAYIISKFSASSGLFGYVGAGGQIKNLIVSDAKIGNGRYAGALAARYASSKAIENCGVNGGTVTITSGSGSTDVPESYAGGLIGYAGGNITISNSYTNNSVSNTSEGYYAEDTYAGGLVGYSVSSITINNSFTTGTVISDVTRGGGVITAFAGGFLGGSAGTITINNSFTTASISAYNGSSMNDEKYYNGIATACGGFVGYGKGNISNSYSQGNVQSYGISGYSGNSSVYAHKVYSGGLVGYASDLWNLSFVYSSGTTGASSKYLTNYTIYKDAIYREFSGDFFGYSNGGANTSIYSKSAELKKKETFVDWDFENIWAIEEDVSYPYFVKKPIAIGLSNKYFYTGNSIEPLPRIRLNNSIADSIFLEKDVDYTISYGENRNVADGGIILINGISSYQGVFSEAINFDIIPKELSISSGNVENKVYDGTTTATVTEAILDGVIGDDVVSVNTIGEFADKNVGSTKAVNVTLTGIDAENYKITVPTGLTANITKKPLVVSIEPKTYNISLSDELPNFAENLTYTSFVDGDTKAVINGTTNINCSYVNGTSPEGKYPISLSGSLVAENYQVSYDNAELFLIVGDGTPIHKIQKSNNRYGIKFTSNIVSNNAEISVILPNSEKATQTKIAVYDAIGNIVFETTVHGDKNISWNLTNNAGRIVANSTYLVIAEVKGQNGMSYHYSAKLGVRK